MTHFHIYLHEWRETAEENKYCHSLPGGDPISEHRWKESAVIAYLTHFSVRICDSNGPLSLEQMPLTDVIQLPTVTVNKTMNCSSPARSIHYSFTINRNNTKS